MLNELSYHVMLVGGGDVRLAKMADADGTGGTRQSGNVNLDVCRGRYWALRSVRDPWPRIVNLVHA